MVKKKTLYSKFLGYLTKKGNVVVAQKTLRQVLLKVSKATNIQTHFILSKVFTKLNIFVETKKVKIKRGSHVVPFAISFNRKIYLIIKWILESAREDKRRVPFADKLVFEILNILSNKNSKALKKRSLNISQALSNRSNIHFRW